MNEKNLKKLAAYLAKLPSGYGQFSMFNYISDGTPPADAKEIDCGTVACAVGHGPAAGIKAKQDEDWSCYEDRVFDLTSAQWDWCFDSEWRHIDDTPQGAAKRILYMLENGVPADYGEQMAGINYLFAGEK